MDINSFFDDQISKINYKNFYIFNFISFFIYFICIMIGITLVGSPIIYPDMKLFPNNHFLRIISEFAGLILIMIAAFDYFIIYDLAIHQLKKRVPFDRLLNVKPSKLFHYIINPINSEMDPELVEFVTALDEDKHLTQHQSEMILRILELTTGRELLDLILASVAIFYGFFYVDILEGKNNNYLQITFLVVISYLGHELAHKLAANKIGINSRFTLSIPLLFITLFAGLFNLGLAIPGGVSLSETKEEKNDIRKHGKIALGGILWDFLLAIIAFTLLITSKYLHNNHFNNFLLILMNFNIFLGMINLIPFSIIDGKKIWIWNRLIWLLITLGFIVLAILQYYLV